MNYYDKLKDSTYIAKRDFWFGKMEKVFAGEKPETMFFLRGYEGKGKSSPYEEPEKWVEEVLRDLEEHAEFAADEECFRPLSLECGLYGVHFADRILGAEVFFQDEQWYNHYLNTPIGRIEMPELDENETWILAKRVAEAFVDNGVGLPLFGLPTIASTLNVAINLYGADIMAEWFEEPEAVEHDLNVINEVLCELHRRYQSIIPRNQLQPVISWERTQPPGYGQICGCSTQLLSPQMYGEIFAPLDNQLLSVYQNGGMIHLCGTHKQHIQHFRDMPALKAVQLNDRATWDLQEYYENLRQDQIIYLIPSKEMSVDKAMEITGGKRLIIQRGI